MSVLTNVQGRLKPAICVDFNLRCNYCYRVGQASYSVVGSQSSAHSPELVSLFGSQKWSHVKKILDYCLVN